MGSEELGVEWGVGFGVWGLGFQGLGVLVYLLGRDSRMNDPNNLQIES